jgi:hypothetical protein
MHVFTNQMNDHDYSTILCIDFLNCRTVFLLHSIVPSLMSFVSVPSSMHYLYPITRLSLLRFSLDLSKGLNNACFLFCVWIFCVLTNVLPSRALIFLFVFLHTFSMVVINDNYGSTCILNIAILPEILMHSPTYLFHG